MLRVKFVGEVFQGVGALAPTKNEARSAPPLAAQFPRVVGLAAFRAKTLSTHTNP